MSGDTAHAPQTGAPTSALLRPEVPAHLRALAPIDLRMLERLALLNRIDTKYVMTDMQALHIIDRCRERYNVLEIDNRRAFHYSTQYFDTAELTMFHDHQRGVRDRYKVRLRSYLDAGTTWLEIKCRTNLERTLKRRIPLTTADPEVLAQEMGMFTEEEGYFLRDLTPYNPADLHPSANNEYFRVTLASNDPQKPERITIDFGMHRRWQERSIPLPGIAIAEVKRPRVGGFSPFTTVAHSLHLRPEGFSKYCLSIALLYPHVRSNNFKQTILIVDKTMRTAAQSERESLP